MALSTRWLMVAGGAMLGLVAVAVLPPRTCDDSTQSLSKDAVCSLAGRYGRGTRQAVIAERTRDRLLAALERRRLADSLLARMRAGGARLSAGGVTVLYEGLRADSARRFLDAALRELAMIPGETRGAAVIVSLAPAPAARAAAGDGLAARRLWYRPSLDHFAVFASDARACFVVVRLDRVGRQARSVLAGSRVLDWCALYGRFGAPGPSVERWAASGFGFGWRDYTSLAERVQASRVPTAPRLADEFRTDACLAGSETWCLRFAGMARTPSDEWILAVRERVRDILAFLLAREGAERFARFWRSSAPIGDALAEGYGRPGGDVVRSWATARYRSSRPPTLPRTPVVLASALWAALALAAAFVTADRRRAD